MRSLSLAARGGFVARNLQDMRKVSWDRGQVRLGDVERLDGHRSPRWHDSEVAALAYAIQQILYRRGFLDREGNQVPSRVLSQRRSNGHTDWQPALDSGDDFTELVHGEASSGDPHSLMPMHGRKCSTCGANAVIRKDGCDFCTACGEIGACG
jgi:ribonucleoside-diphosphate reductase alpha chain